jgi:hypothetical protein
MTTLNGIFEGKSGVILFGDPTQNPLKSPCFIMMNNAGPSDIAVTYSLQNGHTNAQQIKAGNSGFIGVGRPFSVAWQSTDENGTAKGTWQIAFSGEDESSS